MIQKTLPTKEIEIISCRLCPLGEWSRTDNFAVDCNLAKVLKNREPDTVPDKCPLKTTDVFVTLKVR